MRGSLIRAGWNRSHLIILFAVWTLSTAYVSRFVDRGWVPHDEGALAQSAVRVLDRELPHRDFDEPYSGGLSYLHALGFKLLGVRLISLRYVLLAFFILFVPAFYLLALRIGSPPVAGLLTLLAVAWSVPNYFSAVPSWYNLFFATLGTLALVRFLDTRRPLWLFLAGVCGGLSLLVKIVGLYYIGGVLFFLLYLEQPSEISAHRRFTLSSFSVLKFIIVAGPSAILLPRILPHLSGMEVFHFLIPVSSIMGYLLWSELRCGRDRFLQRLKRLQEGFLAFLIGVSVPVALFLIPYALSGSLSDLYRGWFVLPQKRMVSAAVPLPPPILLLPSIPYGAMLLLPATPSSRRRRSLYALLLLVVLGVILVLYRLPAVSENVWLSVRNLSVVSVLAAVACLVRLESRGAEASSSRRNVFMFASMAALTSLIQFPFASPIYFCYAAPFIVLAIAAVVAAGKNAFRTLHAIVLAFYLLFALLRINPGYLGGMLFPYLPDSSLSLSRGGLRVYAQEDRLYSDLVRLIHSKNPGEYIYAAPDCPEVYFLSGLRNPTRTIFDFFDDPAGKPDRIRNVLAERQVRVVVVDQLPAFSGPLDPATLSILLEGFPHSQNVGRFHVRWKS